MTDLTKQLSGIFEDSVQSIVASKVARSSSLISNNLITHIICSYDLCSDHLVGFSDSFNNLLKPPREDGQKTTIDAYIIENERVFQEVESIFLHTEWSTNRPVDEFNIATSNTSGSKCTKDGKFYIIKCYDHFYYIYHKESNRCLMVVKDEKKALTMVNILLLTPYLLYGDLYAVHGGLVSDGKNNILLTNSSLGGKTTLSILFLEKGWRIVTEETTYITKHGDILNYNIRNYFNIRVGTYLEFKDFFVKNGIVNTPFLAMSHLKKDELFELGKSEQMSIDFDALPKPEINAVFSQITHVLRVSIDKNKDGVYIEKLNPAESVDRFLEMSLAPTVLLFKSLIGITNLRKSERRDELTRIFKDAKSYSVLSGFDYRKNFDFLIREIGL